MMSKTSPVQPRRGPVATKHLDIMWAAIRLFAQKGIAQTTTREIAAQAGTTERTLFKHFGSKELLLQAVIAEAVVANLAPASLAALADAIRGHAGDLEAWHVGLLNARSKAIGAAPELTRLLLTEILRDEQVRAEFAEQWLAAAWVPLFELFRGLQAEGRLRDDLDPAMLSRMFLSLNIGYLVGRHLLAPSIGWDDAHEIKAIASTFARGVTKSS